MATAVAYETSSLQPTHAEHAGRWRHCRQRTPIQQSHLLLQTHSSLLVCYVLQQRSAQLVQARDLRVCSIRPLRELRRDCGQLRGFCGQHILHLVLNCLAIWPRSTQGAASLKLLQRHPAGRHKGIARYQQTHSQRAGQQLSVCTDSDVEH
jgi:hypothetical protein